MSVENYQLRVFYHSKSLSTVVTFLFPEICLTGCHVSAVLDFNYSSKAGYYSPVNVTLVYPILNLAEKMVQAQHDQVLCLASLL